MFNIYVSLLLLTIHALWCSHGAKSDSDEHSMNGTVYYDISTDSYSITLGVIDCTNGVACGYFDDTLNQTGWGVLEIEVSATNGPSNIDDNIRLYAAGMLEGYITCYQIYLSWYQQWNSDGGSDLFGDYLTQFNNWTATQRTWMEQQISNNPNSQYWKYVDAMTNQYDGQKYGYSLAATKFGLPALTDDFVWQFLVGNADLGDLVNIFDPSKFLKNWHEMSEQQLFNYKSKHTHCSSLVKVTPLLDDIFISHSTWSSYYTMNRIMKTYNFDLDLKPASTKMQMSSYPASLSSIDDYYLMDSGLAVTETTNLMFNNSIWSKVTPESLFVWQRVRIANALTNNGPDWVKMFAEYNSGTYNNQWIVLNTNLFEKSQSLQDNLLWISEQLPGACYSEDVTQVLERGYWASYNVPAIEAVYQISGNAEIAKNAVSLSYDLAPRARIFRRDANKAVNMTGIQKIMRYNNYLNDPIEMGYPGWAIMSRFDLNATSPQAFGGLDTKIANYDMIQALTSSIQAGPTHDDLPAFTWSTDTFVNGSHMGMPMNFEFDWVEIKPKM